MVIFVLTAGLMVRIFRKDGHWPVAFAMMMAGTFLICLGLMALQNIKAW